MDYSIILEIKYFWWLGYQSYFKKGVSGSDFVCKQIRSQIGKGGSADKFLSIVSENIDGKFKLTDDNIEHLLDAYRELYKGMRKK